MERKVTGTGRARPQLFPPFQELLPAHLPRGACRANALSRTAEPGQGRGGDGWEGRRHICAHHQNSVQDTCYPLNTLPYPSPPPSLPLGLPSLLPLKKKIQYTNVIENLILESGKSNINK